MNIYIYISKDNCVINLKIKMSENNLNFKKNELNKNEKKELINLINTQTILY